MGSETFTLRLSTGRLAHFRVPTEQERDWLLGNKHYLFIVQRLTVDRVRVVALRPALAKTRDELGPMIAVLCGFTVADVRDASEEDFWRLFFGLHERMAEALNQESSRLRALPHLSFKQRLALAIKMVALFGPAAKAVGKRRWPNG
jgi:hypothetical protein